MDSVSMTQASKYACSMEVVISRFLKLFLTKSNYNHGAWLAHAIKKNPPKTAPASLMSVILTPQSQDEWATHGDILNFDENSDTWKDSSKKALQTYWKLKL